MSRRGSKVIYHTFFSVTWGQFYFLIIIKYHPRLERSHRMSRRGSGDFISYFLFLIYIYIYIYMCV
ncbi:hypothetical protein T492DRAFT_385564 [Pavlovales sp. CCMP2436]|nr:hypothetical protein T492DRAFT_385564 [Pavlovales sp. CCMP2436]